MLSISGFRLDDRFINFSQIPKGVARDLGSGVTGVINGLGSALTLGTNRKINDAMNVYLCEFTTVASKVYLSVLGFINPNALGKAGAYGVEFTERGAYAVESTDVLLIFDHLDPSNLNLRNLMVRDKVVSFLDGITNSCRSSDSLIKREVFARGSIALTLLASVAARVADTAIGIIVTFLSLAFFGVSYDLNKLAFNQLQAVPGVISDIFAFTILMINPNADFKTETMQ